VHVLHEIKMLFQKSSILINLKLLYRLNHTLINHKIYPLNDRESIQYKELVLTSRQQFTSTGCLYLPHFLTTRTLSTILDEINSIVTNSSSALFDSYVQHTENLYETTTNERKLNEIESSSKTLIAFDQIPSESLLRKLYSWNSLIDFVSDIIQIHPRLYPSCDKLGALYVNIYRQSNKLSWHTDHSHFFVNLLLQQPSISTEGVFEYKTKLNQQIITRNDFQGGGLVLFNGRNYSHRVTEIRLSKLPRINAILTYDSNDHHQLSDYVLQKFFGRTTERK
jgi:alkylated DNA repair dioxygenase AlkB